MSIPLRAAFCATTVALVMAPGVADAADDSPSAKIPDSATATSSVQVAETVSRLQFGRASSRLQMTATTSRLYLTQATGSLHRRIQAVAGMRSRASRTGLNAQLLVRLQAAVRLQRARIEAQWRHRADRAITFALKQRGRPYVWGGTGRRGFDCSGLTQTAWHSAGIRIPRVAATQYRRIKTRVAKRELRAGDLVFFNGLGHVGMYLGKGKFIHSPRPGRSVSVERLSGYYKRNYVGAARPAWRPLPQIPLSLG